MKYYLSEKSFFKKGLALALIGCMVLGTGCTSGGNGGSTATKEPAAQETKEGSKEEKKDTPTPASNEVMSLASASLGGTYYIIGTALGEAITKANIGITANCVVAQGSTGNPLLIKSGETELAMTNYLSGYQAINGEGKYEEKIELAGICPLQYSTLQFMTFKKYDDISSLSDLKGKSIAVGPAGGGGALLVEKLLPYWGIDIKDTNASYISYADGTEALKDGKVVVNVPHGAYPLETISSLASTDDIKIINLEEDKLENVLKDNPYYSKSIIPAGTYKGIDEDVTSIGIQDILVVRSDMSEEQAYNITKAIYEAMESLKGIHPSLAEMTFDNYADSLVPLHPGAKKFYEEMSIPLS